MRPRTCCLPNPLRHCFRDHLQAVPVICVHSWRSDSSPASRARGSAGLRFPSRPVMSSFAIRALSTASSVASATAVKNGSRNGHPDEAEAARSRSSAPGLSAAAPAGKAPGLPVEKARNRSPEKCEPVVPVRASPIGHPPGQRLALAGQQRRVGGHHRDDRPGAGRRRSDSAIGLSSAQHPRRLAPRPPSAPPGSRSWPAGTRRPCSRPREPDEPGGGAGPALEAVAVHPGAAADRALLDRPARGAVQRLDRGQLR